MKNRKISLDMIRFVAIILVVQCHSLQQAMPFMNNGGNGALFLKQTHVEQMCLSLLFVLGRIGVPLFLMLTGYLMLDRNFEEIKYLKKFFTRNFLRLIICFEIWTFIYELILVLVYKQHISIKQYVLTGLFIQNPVTDLIGQYFWHYWFIPAIIGVYLTLPLLSTLLRISSNVILIWMLCIFALFTLIIPDLNTVLSVIGKGNYISTITLGTSVSFSAFYVIMGVLVKRGVFSKLQNWKLSMFTGLIFLFLVAMSFVLDSRYASNQAPTFGVWYTNPFLALLAMLLFARLERLKITNDKVSEFMTKMSKLSLGVYLIHRPIQMFLNHYHILTTQNSYIYMFVLFIISIFLAYSITWILSKIPILGRFLLNLK